jgi:hypothetical protein
MAVLKHKIETLRQGYPVVVNAQTDTDYLMSDLTRLKAIDADQELRENPFSLEVLEVGKACTALHPVVKAKMIDLCKKQGAIYKLMKSHITTTTTPPENPQTAGKTVNLGDVTFIMPALKKIPRIMEKAVTYAVCDEKVNSAEPVIERVVDILRGTLIFENKEFLLSQPANEENMGSQLIDLINTAFGNNIVQAKNRFMDIRKPMLYNYIAADFAKLLDQPDSHRVTDETQEQANRSLEQQYRHDGQLPAQGARHLLSRSPAAHQAAQWRRISQRQPHDPRLLRAAGDVA